MRTHIASRAPHHATIGWYGLFTPPNWATGTLVTSIGRPSNKRHRDGSSTETAMGFAKFYRRFEREFDGAVPTGPWAEHFSIICWPITHAILPKDLQVQLARTLYESRYLLSEDVLRSPQLLGDLIAARTWNASSRFRNLAQDTRLLGQIAAALLIQEQAGSDELVYPATLRRISEDLDRERQAREWLRRATSFRRRTRANQRSRLPQQPDISL